MQWPRLEGDSPSLRPSPAFLSSWRNGRRTPTKRENCPGSTPGEDAMSRSRRARCPRGKGCGICPDRSEVRRTREHEAGAIDARDGLVEYNYEPRRLSHAYAMGWDVFDEHPNCEYCGTLIPEFDVP